jgi:fibronectin-binding autotransporter adhesin
LTTPLSGGTLFPNDPTAFGSTVGSTLVNSGGSIFTVQNNTYNGEAVTINGTGNSVGGNPVNDGALHAGGATTSTFDGPITVASNSLINLDGGATLALTNTNALTGSNVTVSLAGGGTLSIGGNVNLGASGSISTGTASFLTFDPPTSTTITVSSPIVGGRPLTFNTAGTPDETTLGTTIVAVDNPSLTGTINVASGNLQIQTAGALGTGVVTVNGSGAATTVLGSLRIASGGGSLSITTPITVGARQGTALDVPHLENVSGTNTYSGAITPTTGGTDYNFASDAGLLTIQSAFSTTGLPTARNLKLQGAGDGAWSGVISDIAAASLTVVKSGGGTWTLSGANTYTAGTTVNAGTLTTTATGSIGGGPLAVNAADTVTSTVNIGNSQSVSSLSGTLSGSGSARVNVAAGITLTDTDTSSNTYAGSIGLGASGTAHGGGTFSFTGNGSLETQTAPSLGNNSNLNVTGGGTLRFNVTTGGPAVVGSGVLATVSNASVLELAGTVAALSDGTGPHSAGVLNNSTAAVGLHVTGGNQRVGAVDGTGTTSLDSGTSLTANHIVQGTLAIGGLSGSPSTVTIGASDASGNPLGSSSGLALAGSLEPTDSFAAGTSSSAALQGEDSLAGSGSSAPVTGASAVPEPSSIVLLVLAGIACLARAVRRRTRRD